MKFDVIVGNPPYNPPSSNGRGTGNTLYDKFIRTALKLVKPEGYICYVHPPNWRKPAGKMKIWPEISGLQFHRLAIFNSKDGMKTFGAGTRYDWYVLQNTPISRPTSVRDEEGDEVEVDFRDWDWLPNTEFGLIRNLLVEDREVCPLVSGRCVYSTTSKIVSKVKSDEFCYPLVHTTPKTGTRFCWSSVNDRGHFGISKVVFGDSGINNPVIDMDGVYGMTEHAMAIEVRDLEEAQMVKRALLSKGFERVLAATKWSNFQIDRHIFNNFRRDWYLEFQDE